MSLLKKIELISLLLITCTVMQAQENIAKDIEDEFIHNQQSILTEKIFVHSDKNFYLAGEIAWFKLYYTEGGTHQPLDLSKVAYVDILDKDQKSVLQCKIALNEGTGNGSLYLPVTLNSGVYKLRAYTNWMKNFNADYYFEKPITIINTLKNLETSTPASRNFDIQFFPEGGNLVQDLESTIAFRVVDQSGKGLNCKGVVINNKNDTVAKFQPLKFGIGRFNLTPQANNSYQAIITFPDTVIIRALPEIFNKGYVMRVANESATQLKISIQTNILSGKSVFLFAHTRQSIKIEGSSAIISGKAEFIIDKNKLGEGISHLTIFNSEKQPVCERLFFIRPVQKLNIETTTINQQYGSRKKLGISIATSDETGKPIAADMSVSVYRLGPLQESDEANISNYFWLTSDLNGAIESPEYYFSAKDQQADEALDNLMLTHGWRRFTWQNVLQTSQPMFHFIPEWKGHIITGRITDIKSDLPAANKTVYLSVPGKRIQLYGSQSDQQGNVRFYTKDFYGPNEIVLQTDSRVDSTYSIEVTSPFSSAISLNPLPPLELPADLKGTLTQNNIGVQVQNSFFSDKLKQFYIPRIDSSAFFGKPDKQYMLDDYTRFSTMEEVLREYVYEVLVRRQKDNFRLIMADGENKIFMDDPITLFNGVPVFQTNKVIQYDPLKVKKVEVIKRKYFYGPLILNGLVNFTTYYPEPSMVSDSHSEVLDYEGLQYQREFFSPVYETPEQLSSRLPDFREVLYWSPEVKSNEQGKTEINFYTSDQKGKYRVLFQGMNGEGKVGVQSFSFEVK